LFDHKGLIEAMPPEKTPLETAVEHAIEAGAEDVIELQDTEDSGLQVRIPPPYESAKGISVYASHIQWTAGSFCRSF